MRENYDQLKNQFATALESIDALKLALNDREEEVRIVRIDNFMPEYFLGEQINPACKDCLRAANILIGDEVSDPFSSFSDGMPTSLSAHWIPPYMGISSPCISYLSSFRAHYVLLPNPGSRLISMEEVMREFKLIMEELQRDMLEKWKQM